MPTIIVYLVKCSLGIAALYIFYRVFFRRLTFYNNNRWILTGFSMACFVFPFININQWFQQQGLQQAQVIDWVPAISLPLQEEYSTTSVAADSVSIYAAIAAILGIGMVVMLLKLLIQIWSFRKLIQKATMLDAGDTTIYEMTDHVIPFSFGNAIFINPALHSEAELEKIIQHEFIHVKEKHSIDIIWGEILQIVCWYNPFAWWLKKAIRQNLEFIADQKVLQHGYSKKEYQYLLLKVMGTQPFRIATGFSFFSLKKRIAMMNKNKSSRFHALQFLLLLPVVALLLLSFRKQIQGRFWKADSVQTTDTIPKTSHRVDEVSFNSDVESIRYKNNERIVTLKNGTVEKYNMSNDEESKRFVEGYGDIPAPPTPPPVPGTPDMLAPPPVPPIEGKSFTTGQELSFISDSIIYNATTKKLSFSEAQVKWVERNLSFDGVKKLFNSRGQAIDAENMMVLIDGMDFTGLRDYTAPKGSAFKVKKLDKNEAMKKYGERGKNGAIEIQAIQKKTAIVFLILLGHLYRPKAMVVK
jgi:hypothetical protein